MQPLRIRAYLQDGRVAGGDATMALDGILAFGAVVRDYGDVYFCSFEARPAVQPDLPLARRGREREWYWACSGNVAAPATEYVVHWHKHTGADHIDYLAEGRRKKIPVGSGLFRAYRTPMAVLLFDYLEWFAFGDRQAVADLCACVTHVGKKTSQGFGAVQRWEIVPWDEDWSCWRDGRPTRAIPLSDLPGGTPMGGLAVGRRGIRPPYWHSPAWAHACWSTTVDKPLRGSYTGSEGGEPRPAAAE